MEMLCECLVEKRKATKIMNTFSLWFKSHKRSDKWNALFFSYSWKQGRFHTCDWRHRLSPNDQISSFLSVVLFRCRTLPFLTFFSIPLSLSHSFFVSIEFGNSKLQRSDAISKSRNSKWLQQHQLIIVETKNECLLYV